MIQRGTDFHSASLLLARFFVGQLLGLLLYDD